MSDLIRRQDALDAIRKNVSKLDTKDSHCYNLGLGIAEKVVESLPSAEPKVKCIAQIKFDRDDMEDLANEIVEKMAEPKTGKWKIDEYGIYHCQICHEINNTVYKSFCPNCGADMRGEEE